MRRRIATTRPATSTASPVTSTEEPRRRRHRRERSGDGLLADIDWDEFNEMPVLMSAGASRSTNAARAESRWGVAMGLRNTHFGDDTPLSFGYDFRVAWAHYRWAEARGLVGLGLPLWRF